MHLFIHSFNLFLFIYLFIRSFIYLEFKDSVGILRIFSVE
jgi:hypothetical protein